MKKMPKSYARNEPTDSVVNEQMSLYSASPNLLALNKQKVAVSTKAFTYKNFKKILDKAPFTLAEWADFLFISERTLQRYAKANTEFSGLHVERILQLEKLIISGTTLFGDNFKSWLNKPSIKFNGATPYSQLYTYAGILSVINYLGQLEWGIFA